MSELLPCPFCGGTPNISETDYGLCRWVWCEKCEADGPCIPYVFEGTNEEARAFVIEKWNTRQVPKIKPLVWERGNELIDEWTAETPFGKFRVFRRPQDEVARIYLSAIKNIKHPHIESVEETKAYCEAEYERCVMECVEETKAYCEAEYERCVMECLE